MYIKTCLKLCKERDIECDIWLLGKNILYYLKVKPRRNAMRKKLSPGAKKAYAAIQRCLVDNESKKLSPGAKKAYAAIQRCVGVVPIKKTPTLLKDFQGSVMFPIRKD